MAPQEAQLNEERLGDLRRAIEGDVARGRYHGAVIAVARHGHIGLQVAIGTADAEHRKPLELNSVFSIFSVTKAFTNVLALKAIEQGRLALTTPIAQIIPEFSGGLRDRITIFHLMTHTSGLPMVFSPKPEMYIDHLDEIITAICENIFPSEPPGQTVAYSPICNHALLGEALRRIDPQRRTYRALVDEELTRPLAMRDTAIGLRADLKSRHVVPDFRGNFPINHPGHSNLGPNGAFEEEHAEMPWVGAVSTVPDMLRFAEMLRRGGKGDEGRILSPATLELATRNWTGERPNELYKTLAHRRGWEPAPAYIGLGFSLRGPTICHHLFGTLASPGTFGNYGAGTTLFWVDPARALSFVCLSAGVMESNDNIERFQRLSDMAVSAAV